MWLAALAVLLAVCLYLFLDTLKPRKFPPGPKWTPILGCAKEVYKLREKTGYLYKAVRELSLTYCKETPVLGLRIGKDRIVMVNSLEANKEMLFNEDIDGRPKGIFYQTRTWGERRGVLLTDGELWKEQRRFLIKHLKEFGFGRSGMGETAKLEAEHIVIDVMHMIGDRGSAVIQMHNFFNVYILNTLWTMMAGNRYNPSDPQMKILQSMLFDLFAAVDMVGTAFSHFPILSIVAPTLSGYRNFIKTHKRIWKFLREELARHKDSFQPDKEDKDFMDVYIRALREHGEVNTYSEGQLVAMCMDMFMAGTETTSKSMSFCFSYLVREQEVQRKAQEEIDRVVGKDRVPSVNDRPNMPYNEAIVHECVRHFMGRTFGVPHRALRDTTLAGCHIPEDTMVVSNYTNILLDENYFPEPYSFKPERFLVNGRVSLPDHYFPFGLAKHRCMGDALAKCNIFVFTTTMLQRFSLVPVPGEGLPSLDHMDGATPSAAPFKALVIPRI
ncbi:probable cytochrome P450 303a1 [Bombyx mori]|uniref:Cytochrome P450 303a1 n=2 Tax=Bombyx mori TaxID=7091 RepID=A0A8R2HU29_BOMMO|nr:probable cytochrome P450 303a1 [Bombyx mori]XP_021208040.1 probable cytochrome P450 303a1 [Bombyx mori]